MKKEERLERAVGAAMACLRDLSANITAKETLVYIYNLLATSPPEIEEVEVVRWMCGECQQIYVNEGDAAARCCESVATCKVPHVKLTGTLKRPKPQPVERTVSVPCRITGYPVDEFIGKPINLHSGERLYAFAEEDECHGKTGLLSFTWTEDPK